MYPPHRVPSGPHYVYIFYDEASSRFKIGESRRPTERRTEAARKVLSWHLRPTLKIHRKWKFKNYFAGIHVEQAAIDFLKLHGFSPAIKPDWFQTDRGTMDAVIAVIDDLAKLIIGWEDRHCDTECDAFQIGRPYGEYLQDTDYVTLGQIWKKDDGKLQHEAPDIPAAIARAKRSYQRTRRKMPDGLTRLIAEFEINTLSGSD